jgi:hypothetical protein
MEDTYNKYSLSVDLYFFYFILNDKTNEFIYHPVLYINLD